MRIRRFIIFLMLVAAVVIVLFFVNELFTQSEPTTLPLPNENWPSYEPTTYVPPTATPTAIPTATPTKVPGALVGLVDPNATSTVSTTSSFATSTPTATPTQRPTPTPTQKPTAKPTATPTSSALRNGSEGSRVRSVQQKLKDLGYLTGSVDGSFGDATEAAVKAFQRANSLYADGVVGEQTLEKLNSSKAKAASTESLAKATSKPTPKTYTPSEPENYRYLQLGISGGDVRRLQKRLVELGYLNQEATGTYDEATKAAVIAFQERNGQWVDGVAGEDTQSVLFSSGALPAKNN